MGLLKKIQSELMEENSNIGSILLKLQFLADRLGSDVLEEWVKYEGNGYPADIDVPDYRRIKIAYHGNFSGPWGREIKNAPIPLTLIQEFCGENWTGYDVREGTAEINDLLNSDNETIYISSSDLIIPLQGKIYEGYACNSIRASFPKAAFRGIQQVVKSRILEFTMELEKKIPTAAEIEIDKPDKISTEDTQTINNITHQVFHGDYTSITNAGDNAQISVNVSVGDKASFIKTLTDAGIPATDAKELADIVASEKPENSSEPWGTKAKAWVRRNMKKALDGSWNVAGQVVTDVLTRAAMGYYGLK